MLELLTTDAFATWFAALPVAPAEDVAATLEVVVQLGTRTEAPGSSEWLLWYEHPSLSQHLGAWASAPRAVPPELVKFSQDWGHFNSYARRVIKHLESKEFSARLARLTPEAAANVAAAVQRLRRIPTARALAVSDALLRRVRSPSAAASEALVRLPDVSEIREAYFAALAAAGFEVADTPDHSAALREISLRGVAPGLRLLYGLDVPRNRGLVVLGEWLDRSFYGDSVRHAEAVWREFLEGRPLPTQTSNTGAR